MPIGVAHNLVVLSQKEFSEIAYDVMSVAFQIHNKLGSLYDEKVYQDALINQIKPSLKEVKITVSFESFTKYFFLDLLVKDGAIFEIKTVQTLTEKHTNQLIQYLLLTELNHGKIINFRSNKVEHEFVNTSLSYKDRTNFKINDENWRETRGFSRIEKTYITELIKDLGTGLTRQLYSEAFINYLGGLNKVEKDVSVYLNGTQFSKQKVLLCSENVSFCFTTFQHNLEHFSSKLTSLLDTTKLEIFQWINISRKELTFRTIFTN